MTSERFTIEDEARDAVAAGFGRQSERRAHRHHDAKLVGAVLTILRHYDYEYGQGSQDALDRAMGLRDALAALAGLFGVSVSDPSWIQRLRLEVGVQP